MYQQMNSLMCALNDYLISVTQQNKHILRLSSLKPLFKSYNNNKKNNADAS